MPEIFRKKVVFMIYLNNGELDSIAIFAFLRYFNMIFDYLDKG